MAPPWAKEALVGSRLQSVSRSEHSWSFAFAPGCGIETDSFWRIRSDGGILVTNEDDGQRFGLPEPVDAADRAVKRLKAAVAEVELVPDTSDLRIVFEDGAILEVFNTSCGYESWQLYSKDACLRLIALGGGNTAICAC